MNPIFQYLVIKSNLVTRAKCPQCQHRFEVLRKDSHRQVNCLKCGKSFHISKDNRI